MVKYNFQQVTYEYEITDQTLIQKINLADLKTKEQAILRLLESKNPLFLPVKLELKQDYLALISPLPVNYQTMAHMKTELDSRKIQVLLNLLQVQMLSKSSLGTILVPQNIILDYNLQPLFIYRGLKNYMPTQTLSESTIVEFIKLCAGYLFTKHNYQELAEGLLQKVAPKNHFLEGLLEMTTYAELKSYLEQQLEDVVKRERTHYKVIKKRNYIVWQQCAIWFGVISLAALIPLGILGLSTIPHDKSYLASDQEFIQNKYDSVIKNLENIKLEDLPQAQKYELAVAYVEGSGFDNTQRDNIMHNLNIRSKTEYLDFWIQIGRGDFEDALNNARNLEDSNLIKYALLKNMDAVRQNKKLKAEDKQAQLTKLNEEYKKLDEKGSK